MLRSRVFLFKILTKNTVDKKFLAYKRVNRSRDSLDLTFNDYKTAFKSRTSGELCRALFVYYLSSSNFLVDNNAKLMNIGKQILGKNLFSWLMKRTFYGHFVAGENEEQIKPIMSRLSSFGVHSILDYSVEDDISQEEGQKRDTSALVSESHPKDAGLPKFRTNVSFPDRRFKVQSARTYFYLNEATCEKNMETFLKCLQAAAEDGKGYVAIKITALGRPQLLLEVSEVIAKARAYIENLTGQAGNVMEHHLTKSQVFKKLVDLGVSPSKCERFLSSATFDEEGLIHIFPWSGIIDKNLQLNEAFLVPNVVTGQLEPMICLLTKKEEETFQNMIRRVTTVVQTAVDMNVSVLIDAEQTYFQGAISRLAMELMRKFNKNRAVVFNTYQCYLQDAFTELKADMLQAQRQKFYFGAKLVRGAYLEQERARAEAMGYPDPTNASFEETSEMYHKCLSECLENVKTLKEMRSDPRRVSVMVASHNEDTVRFALEKMLDMGVRPEDNVVSFGQLYGMRDYITFPLGQAGFSVYKYIPYGPIDEVLPYLSRRMQENKGILLNVKKEKSLLRKELIRRIVSLQLFKKPEGHYNPE